MQLDYNKAQEIIAKSTVLFDSKQIIQAIDKLANNIGQEINGQIPVFLTVMNGGIFFAAELLKRLKNPFICDYIHASRYGEEQYGATHITWFRQPKDELIRGRIVYILDDILDEGHTLAEIKRFLINAGAVDCKIVVLVDKDIAKTKPIQATHVGLEAPNKFLFGCGMDIFGLYRQLPEIYIYNNQS